jgi:hypothetical protein
MDRADEDGQALLEVSLDPADLARFEHRFRMKALDPEDKMPAGR